MDAATMITKEASFFKVICDDRCAMVRRLGSVVKRWDTSKKFEFVERSAETYDNQENYRRLDASRWSLVLIDDLNNQWEGPEAIPFILKNLPFGRLAAVFYILPGTMWLTRKLYKALSQNRRMFLERVPAQEH
ncbi:MAG TPA: DCC1-like thiol-disulfide oxidoreductase family protein [Oculatellaceae cyanobacterium]